MFQHYRRGETLEGTIDALNYTGIRFIRCGLEDKISVDDMITLYKQTGARIAYGLLSGGTDLDRLLRESRQLASAGVLLAIEGNNEPNNWGITYQGETGGRICRGCPWQSFKGICIRRSKAIPS